MRKFLTRSVGAFLKSKGGVSAVEFAIIFPVMLVLLLGTVSIGQAIAIQRKMTILTRSMSDMYAQLETTNSHEVGYGQYAGRLYLTPYKVDPLVLIISSIWRSSNGATTVDWSFGTVNGHPWGSAYTVPADQPLPRENSLIVAEARYDYKIPFGQNLFGDSIQLSSTTYMQPRKTNRVTLDY